MPPALMFMKTEVRLARASDKKKFLRLALERDAGLNLSSHYYPPFRKIIGKARYRNRKFDDLVEAKKLFAKAEEITASYGHQKIFSSTNPDNIISLKMHKKMGYRRCGFINGIETPTSRELFLSKNLGSKKLN